MARITREKHGATELRLLCFCENTTGLLLYSHLGFTPYDIEKRKKRDGKETALILLRKHIVQ